jgi:hypothetical protein
MKEVFISRPNWVPEPFEKGLENFYNLLKAHELNPRTIGRSDYPNKSPLDEVIGLLKKCQGTIVLGIPQINIEAGRIKGQDIVNGLQLCTEWNHIEAALAYSLKHPLLVIHDLEISRGIFDRGAGSYFLHQVNFSNPSWSMAAEISGALSNWKAELAV